MGRKTSESQPRLNASLMLYCPQDGTFYTGTCLCFHCNWRWQSIADSQTLQLGIVHDWAGPFLANLSSFLARLGAKLQEALKWLVWLLQGYLLPRTWRLFRQARPTMSDLAPARNQPGKVACVPRGRPCSAACSNKYFGHQDATVHLSREAWELRWVAESPSTRICALMNTLWCRRSIP